LEPKGVCLLFVCNLWSRHGGCTSVYLGEVYWDNASIGFNSEPKGKSWTCLDYWSAENKKRTKIKFQELGKLKIAHSFQVCTSRLNAWNTVRISGPTTNWICKWYWPQDQEINTELDTDNFSVCYGLILPQHMFSNIFCYQLISELSSESRKEPSRFLYCDYFLNASSIDRAYELN
jgi:hypothetical protein